MTRAADDFPAIHARVASHRGGLVRLCASRYVVVAIRGSLHDLVSKAMSNQSVQDGCRSSRRRSMPVGPGSPGHTRRERH